MQNGGEASPSISPANRGYLVKILITPQPHNILRSFLTTHKVKDLSGHWYAK